VKHLASTGIAAAAVFTALVAQAAPASAAAVEELRYSFDAAPSGGSASGPWTSGCFADSAGTANNACITLPTTGPAGSVGRGVLRGGTPSIKFNATVGADDATSQKVMLRVPHAASLNPGSADFTVSAFVKLDSGDIASATAGANVVQKGLNSTVGGQWKMQVDGGKPGCRLIANDTNRTELLAKWPTSIVGQGWKFVRCERRHTGTGATATTTLQIFVAGTAGELKSAPGLLGVSNSSDVTIGAKSVGANNDQFRGSLDNVLFTVG
jgi:hypothetical protein